MIVILPIAQKRQFRRLFEALPATPDRTAVFGTANDLIMRRAENQGGKHLRTCSLLLLLGSSLLAFGQSGDVSPCSADQLNPPAQSPPSTIGNRPARRTQTGA